MKTSILYIDSDSAIRGMMSLWLRKGFEVITASNASSALKLLKERNVDYVISEQFLDEMTGVDLLEIVHSKYPQTKTVLVTSYSDPRAILNVVNDVGINYCLSKPFEMNDLSCLLNKSARA